MDAYSKLDFPGNKIASDMPELNRRPHRAMAV